MNQNELERRARDEAESAGRIGNLFGWASEPVPPPTPEEEARWARRAAEVAALSARIEARWERANPDHRRVRRPR